MMVPIAKNLDNAGFEGIELIAGSHLKENRARTERRPMERVRLITKKITQTPLRVISGPVNSFEYNPPSMFPSVFGTDGGLRVFARRALRMNGTTTKAGNSASASPIPSA